MTQCTPIRMRTPRQVKGSSISTICRRANNGQVNNTVDGVTGETITYQYDSLKRLLTATSAIHGSTSWQENYTYDGFGNLTTMAPYPTLNMGVNWQTNQLTNGTGYDSYGNVTSLPPPSTTTMSYDVGNRMVNVNGAQVYAYDQGNQRVYYRNTSGVETIYLYGAGGQKLAAYQTTVASQAITLTFQSGNVYFAGKLVGAENNAVAVDGLGSVRWSAAGGGHTYYPYGVEYSTSSGDTEKYATYTRDSLTGFDYAMNRYYFSQWGRFMSPDQYKSNNGGSGNPRDPGTWNRYAYTGDDPINRLDPSGNYFVLLYGGWCWGGGEDGGGYLCDIYGNAGAFMPVGMGGGGDGGGGGEGPWGRALNALGLAMSIVSGDLAPGTISGDCQGDIDALNATASTIPGAQTVSDATLAVAVVGMNPRNGLSATELVSSLNDPSITQPNILNATISSWFTNSK